MVENGEVFTWGDPSEGALGHGELDYSMKLQMRQNEPKQVEGAYASRTKFIDIACGQAHTVFLSGRSTFSPFHLLMELPEGGEVACCGRGAEGQLGYGGRQEHFTPRKIEVTLERNEDEEITKKGIRVFAGASATGMICLDGEFYFWGDGQVYPDRVEGIRSDPVVQVALHPTCGLLLTETNKVYTYDSQDLSNRDTLDAIRAPWNVPSICFVAAGRRNFAMLVGEKVPDLTGDRQLVASNDTNRAREKVESSQRSELFATTERSKRRVLGEDVKTNTTLDKMKEDLFSLPSSKAPASTTRQTAARPSGGRPVEPNDHARNELFGMAPRKAPAPPPEAAPAIPRRPNEGHADPKSPSLPQGRPSTTEDPNNLDAFKQQLLGPGAASYPHAPASTKVLREPSEESEEFIDELPANCTLRQPETFRPNRLLDDDLPQTEAFRGVDFVDDDDLL